jgi:ribosome recycling factor
MAEELTPSEMEAKKQAVQAALVELREGIRENPAVLHRIMHETYDATTEPAPIVSPPTSEYRDD